MTHSLTLGSLLLTQTYPDPIHGYEFNVLADGMTTGAAEGVREVVTALLSDGQFVRTTRYGNREVSFKVEITGPSLSALAHGEAALRREVGRSNLLTWQAPDVLSVPTVFEVITSDMSQTFDDLDELGKRRTFSLQLTCAPFARSQNATTIGTLAVGATPTTTTVDTCTVTTGWTGKRGTSSTPVSAGFIAPDSVGIGELDDYMTSPEEWTIIRTGTVDLSTLPYLVTEIRTLSPYGGVQGYATTSTGARVSLELQEITLLDSNFRRYRWLLPVGAATTVTKLEFTHTSHLGETWQGIIVRHVEKSNQPPGQTARQQSRIIEVGGTERTPGSLRIGAPNGTSALNLTLVSTWPENGSGFSPPLRRWRTSGNTETVDANTLSGKRETLGTSYVQCDVPIASLPPGTYQLMALMRSSVVGNYTVEASIQSRMNGVTLGETPWSEVVNFPVANDWKLVPMGVYSVPIVAAKAGEFRIIFRTPSITTAEYDEAWLFPVDDDCALTSSLVAEPYLWLDSPDLESSVPHVLEGTAANKSDAHWPRYGIHTMGNHVFSTPRTAVFTATFGVEHPDVSLTYFKRWHSNAAED